MRRGYQWELMGSLVAYLEIRGLWSMQVADFYQA
jgi:hypothetical protein